MNDIQEAWGMAGTRKKIEIHWQHPENPAAFSDSAHSASYQNITAGTAGGGTRWVIVIAIVIVIIYLKMYPNVFFFICIFLYTLNEKRSLCNLRSNLLVWRICYRERLSIKLREKILPIKSFISAENFRSGSAPHRVLAHITAGYYTQLQGVSDVALLPLRGSKIGPIATDGNMCLWAHWW